MSAKEMFEKLGYEYIDLDKIPVIIDEEKIQELYNGDYKKALEDIGKNERNLAIKNSLLKQERDKYKEVLDKIKEYINNIKNLYWVEDDTPRYVSEDILELLEEIE